MANRVTSSEVKEIIATSLTDVTAFITPANLIVTEKLANSGLSDDHLKEIEKWLSAHFVAIRDPRLQSQSIGSISEAYQVGTGVDLDSTSYGQQVKLLDTTGLISSLGKQKARLYTIKFLDLT